MEISPICRDQKCISTFVVFISFNFFFFFFLLLKPVFIALEFYLYLLIIGLLVDFLLSLIIFCNFYIIEKRKYKM